VPPRKPSPIGAHVPVRGGLVRGALGYAERVGADAVQVFVSNPRGWAGAPGSEREDAAFRETCAHRRVTSFVHAPYLVNLASPNPLTRERSVEAVRHTLHRGTRLGAAGVVVHAGSAITGERRDEALRAVRESLLPLLDTLPATGPRVLVEPTAGGGESLAARVGDLAGYFAALESHPALGVCLDTCHAYAAGHDVASPGGMRTTLNALVRAVGRGRLGLVHVNDSRDPLGSGRDRHARPGTGHIGTEPLGELFVHPGTRGVALVLETPGGEDAVREDIDLLRRLRATGP
jgi:deoxyribonuclease-4